MLVVYVVDEVEIVRREEERRERLTTEDRKTISSSSAQSLGVGQRSVYMSAEVHPDKVTASPLASSNRS